MSKRIVLASSSPRRKELLEQIGLQFEIKESPYEEDMTAKSDPYELAKFLALNKAQAIVDDCKDSIIIGADTFIALEEEFLGKPGSPERAKEMLRQISGRAIKIVTGFALIDTETNQVINDYGEAIAHIKKLTDQEIEDYVATGEPIDRAGAYVAQELGAVFTERIEGDFSAIVGLPLNKIYCALGQLGINVLGGLTKVKK